MSASPLTPVFRSHDLAIRLDDDTWAALERTAEARGESPSDLVVYAIEQLLERAGFVPDWAQAPLDARLPRTARRRD